MKADNLDEAKRLLLEDEEFVTISTVRLLDKGKSTLFGFVKRPDLYEGELEQDEAIEFIFKNRKARMYVRTGSSICPPKSLFQFKDLPEWLWGCTQLGWDTKADIKLTLRGYVPIVEMNIYRQLGSDPQDLMRRFSHIAEELFFCGLMNFTVKSKERQISFTEYEPVCYSLINYYKSTLLAEIERIKNGESQGESIHIFDPMKIDVTHIQDQARIEDLKEALEVSFRRFKEFLTKKTFSFL